MVHITHNKHRLLELTIHIICWGLFFGFPLFFTQDDSGSIDWREFINHSGVSLSFFVIFYINYLLFIPKVLFKEHTGQPFWRVSFFLRYLLYQLPVIYS